MNTKQLINISLDIGYQMLISGAEVGRVEDTIKRICRSYKAAETNVLQLPPQ